MDKHIMCQAQHRPEESEAERLAYEIASYRMEAGEVEICLLGYGEDVRKKCAIAARDMLKDFWPHGENVYKKIMGVPLP